LLRSQALLWDGCCNVRDLGGLPTEDGSETRFGVVVRADDVALLSEPGWQALRDYGVGRIVDLRHEHDGYGAPVEVVRVPLVTPDGWARVDGVLEGELDPVVYRRRNYLFLLEHFPQNFARAVAAVATAPQGPTLIHCAGGVDRTGLVAALLLRVAGVGIGTIAEDYAESEVSWAPTVGEWIAEAPDETERTKRRLQSVMPAAAMRDVLVELERQHGSARGYLSRAGVEPPELDRLRVRLRG